MGPMKVKILAVVVAVMFLLTQSGCAFLNKNQMQTSTAYAENPVADFDTRMKKEEKEWILMVLIVLGIAIAVGASISASGGGNGFVMGINN